MSEWEQAEGGPVMVLNRIEKCREPVKPYPTNENNSEVESRKQKVVNVKCTLPFWGGVGQKPEIPERNWFAGIEKALSIFEAGKMPKVTGSCSQRLKKRGV